jgi:uncharacterized protein YacL
MIVMVLMIFVIIWFVNTAKKRGQNEYLWAAIGALSFYLPVLFFGLYIYPFIINRFSVSETEIHFSIIRVCGNLVLGFLGVAIAMTALRKKKKQ